MTNRPTLTALELREEPARWAALGFSITGGRLEVDGVTVALTGGAGGIVGWSVAGLPPVDGLPASVSTSSPPGGDPARGGTAGGGPARGGTAGDGPARGSSDGADRGPAVDHPNGVIGIDHLVVVVPDFDAVAAALDAAGLPFRRVRQARDTIRQGFRRLGPVILEVVEAPARDTPGFWGLTLVAEDLERLRAHTGGHLGPARPAVQPGRRIAVLAASAGLSTRVAFMDPDRRNPHARSS